MTEQKDQSDDLNNATLALLEKIKEAYEEEYPHEYKLILQNLIAVSRELNSIRIEVIKKPLKTKTDENNKCHNETEM